jgi:hypothetical protein
MAVEDADRERALADISLALADAIGFEGSPPRALLERVAVDPAFLGRLIDERPTDIAASPLAVEAVAAGIPKWTLPPSAVVLESFARALIEWGRQGFKPVSETQALRRRAACLACDQLREPGMGALGIVHRLVGANSGVCGLCSCAVDRKIRLPTETCPAPSADDPSLSRWGEPRASAESA